jgi:FkbH-like protein
MSPTTILNVLKYRAERSSDHIVYRILDDREREIKAVTYSHLDQQARAIASVLVHVDTFGKPVLLVYPQCLEYIASLLACWYAGAIAVPAYPPKSNRADARLRHLTSECKARVLLTLSSLVPTVDYQFNALCPSQDKCRVIATDQISSSLNGACRFPQVRGESVALLQYTSGSTSSPRGVMITHNNIVHNSKLLQDAFEYNVNSICVSWLPMYHDMGLIGGVIQPLMGGFPCVLMSSALFLRDPAAWLRAVSKYKATISGGPNFAFDLCTRRVTESDKKELELSSWTIAFNGSEQISPRTMRDFAASFAPCGFHMRSFRPCYGLAEATLIVAGKSGADSPVVARIDPVALSLGRFSRETGTGGRELAGCGCTVGEGRVKIVNHNTGEPCPPGVVGEVWISSGSVGAGYWKQAKATAEIFNTHLKGGQGLYLRTGDLGVLEEDELFIVGRLKDVIVIRGQNHYPHDIECSVTSCHPMLQGCRGAAFVVNVRGNEEVVVVSEVSRRAKRHVMGEITIAIRRAVARDHDISLYSVALVREGRIPKTSSGKVQRSICREKFLAHMLGELTRDDFDQQLADAPGTESTEDPAEFLMLQLARYTGAPASAIKLDDSFVDLGLDSLAATELTVKMEKAFGIEVPAGTILRAGTPRQLLGRIRTDAGVAQPRCSSPHHKVTAKTLFSPSYEQERLWSLHALNPFNAACNITCSIRIGGSLNVEILNQCLREVTRRHEIFRVRFRVLEGDTPEVVVDTHGPHIQFAHEDLRGSADPEAAVRSINNLEARQRFDLQQGPLVRTRLLQIRDQEYVLVWTMHHIVGDAESVRIIAHELASLYESFARGTVPILPEPPPQYREFARWQRKALESGMLDRQVEYWHSQLKDAIPLELRTDRPRSGLRRVKHIERVTLPSDLTDRLRKMSRETGCTLFTLLLTAFQVVLSRYSGKPAISVGVPLSGRNHAGSEGMIGPLAHPVVISNVVGGSEAFNTVLQKTRESLFGACDNPDVPYSRMLNAASRDYGLHQSFLSVMFTLVKSPVVTLRSAGLRFETCAAELGDVPNDMYFLLEEGTSIGGQVIYDGALFNSTTIAGVVRSFIKVLEEITVSPDKTTDNIIPGTFTYVPLKIDVLSTFAVPQLLGVLAWWMKQLRVDTVINSGTPGDLLYGLLSALPCTAGQSSGITAVLMRAEDICKDGQEQPTPARPNPNASASARPSVVAIADAVRRSVESKGVPHIVCICPRSPELRDGSAWASSVNDTEVDLFRNLSGIRGVMMIPLERLVPDVDSGPYYDAVGAEIAAAPYSATFVAQLATAIARGIVQVTAARKKAIVLDCDGTLWSGTCAEDGPDGIVLTPGHQYLQECMLRLRRLGVVLCLSSKNDSNDVRAVFARRGDMPLKLDHFTLAKVNLLPKTKNVTEIASALGIELGSMVVIDDDPLEVSELRNSLPETLVVRCPRQPDEIRTALDNIWAFDVTEPTAEDSLRAEFYQHSSEREERRTNALSTMQFRHDVGLVSESRRMTPEDEPRVRQLLERVTRFNLNGQHWSASELREILRGRDVECWVTSVKDRFGEYGIVGVVIPRVNGSTAEIKAWNLSCRALGRGVEIEMLNNVGTVAALANIELIEICYCATARNCLVQEFLSTLSPLSVSASGGGVRYCFSADYLRGLVVGENELRPPAMCSEAKMPATEFSGRNGTTAGIVLGSDLQERIVEDLRFPRKVLEAVFSSSNGCRRRLDVASQGVIAVVLRRLWAEILHTENIRDDQSFFELGGDSLLAARFISQMQQELKLELPMHIFFSTTFTIGEITNTVERYVSGLRGQANEESWISAFNLPEPISGGEPNRAKCASGE